MMAIRLRTSKPSLLLIATLVIGCAVLIFTQPREALYVTVPIVISIWICAWSIVTVWRRDGELPVLDVGIFCIIFTTLYTVVPLLNFYLGGLNFGLLADGRMQTLQPSAAEMGSFSLNYLVYLFALAASYAFFRKANIDLPRDNVRVPGPALETVLVVMFLMGIAYFLVLQFVFGIGVRSGYGDESAIAAGPLWLQQLNGKISGIQSMFLASVLAIVVLRKNDLKVRVLLFLFIFYSIGMDFIRPGSRGELFTVLVMIILFWQRFYGIRAVRVLGIVSIAFLAFMFLGVLRSFLGVEDLLFVLDSLPLTTVASATNEFQALFGTAYDVKHLLETGTEVPSILYFNDLIPMLPPQQFVPFQKLTGADWYLMQIDQFGRGVGFMWTVISQAQIGLGMPELILRGMLLGYLFAAIHRWYQRRYSEFVPTVIYVAMCLNSYWTFRDTTGGIFWFIWWTVIPFMLFLYLLGFRTGNLRTPPSREPSSDIPDFRNLLSNRS